MSMGRVWVEPVISLVTRFLDLYIVFILSYCNFLYVSTTSGTDDVNTSGIDMGIDSFAWLDGEVGDDASTHVIDVHIGLTSE